MTAIVMLSTLSGKGEAGCNLATVSATMMSLAFAIAGCGRDLPERDITQQDYEAFVASFDREHPGRGLDSFDDQLRDRPMAYGLILSAHAQHYATRRDSSARTSMRFAGNWLLENGDINGNGITGYGLSDAWDAFGDGTTNPAHQEYLITTSFVINGLLDWLEADSEAPTDRILATVSAALEPYLSGENNSPSGIYSYSLNPNDTQYDVFNPAAYMAGQMQRYSRIIGEGPERSALQEEAYRNIVTIWEHRRLDEQGRISWYYGKSESLLRPNDLVHAILIVEGFRRYVEYGGRDAEEIDLIQVRNHLLAFYKRGRWVEQLDRWNSHWRPVRLWALGMLLYVLSTEGMDTAGLGALINQIMNLQTDEGRFYYFDGTREHRVRHSAHLLYGMSFYLHR